MKLFGLPPVVSLISPEESTEAAASAAKAGRIHPRAHARGLLRRRINVGERQPVTDTKQPLICCVDDVPDNLDILETLLKSRGYRTVKASDGQQALEIIKKTKPDLILLDVKMPKMDGYEACSRLQSDQELSYIPVIFLTALAEGQDRAKALALGAADYLTKPIQ